MFGYRSLGSFETAGALDRGRHDASVYNVGGSTLDLGTRDPLLFGGISRP